MSNLVENAFVLKKKHKEFIYSVFNRYKFENSKVSFDTQAYGNKERMQVVKKYRTNTSNFMSRKDFVICIAGRNRVEVHSYEVVHKINFAARKETFNMILVGLKVYESKHITKIKFDTYSKEYVYGSHSFGSMGWYRYTYLYNLDEEDISNSPLRYTGVKELSYSNIEHVFKNRNQLERLHVAKMFLLHRDLLENNFNKGILTQRRIVKYRKQIAKHNLGYGEAVTFTRLRDANVNVDPSKVYVYGDCFNLKDCRLTLDKLVKLSNYLHKQKCNINYYFDYLGLMDDINATADTEQTLYPKDLTSAHNKAVSVLNLLEREVEKKIASEKLKQLPKFNYEGRGYCVVSPLKADDLIQEGKALDHCVGSSKYIDGHFGGKYTILFIRELGKSDVPYYTMTLSNKLVVTEVHGKGNKVSKDDRVIKQFVSEEYIPYIKSMFNKNKKTQTNA